MATNKKEVKVTSITTLKQYMNGSVVELPPFSETQPFFARVKRPSLLKMVKEGKIPNQLLTKTNELFVEGSKQLKSGIDDEKLMTEMMDILEIVAEETLVEPSYEQLKENGIELTDNQLMYLFTYSQQGVDVYKRFRDKQESRDSDSAGEGI